MGDAEVRDRNRRPAPVTVTVYGADASRGHACTVSALYRQAFGAPPNDEGEPEFAHQRAAYADLLRRAGFRLALAEDRADCMDCAEAAEPVGFAYGALLAPDTRWWEGMHRPLPSEFTRETGRRTFAIIDMGVLPGRRRRGVGRALHDALLAGCGAERATLSVEPRLVANQRLYRSWGWRRVGRLTGAPTDIAETYDIYVRPLGGRSLDDHLRSPGRPRRS